MYQAELADNGLKKLLLSSHKTTQLAKNSATLLEKTGHTKLTINSNTHRSCMT